MIETLAPVFGDRDVVTVLLEKLRGPLPKRFVIFDDQDATVRQRGSPREMR